MTRQGLLALLLALGGLVAVAYFTLTPAPEPEPEPEPEEVVQPAAEIPDTAPDAVAVPGDTPGPFMTITLAGEAEGRIVIDLLAENAPKHVAQISALAQDGLYDGVVFHRVIEGFMAQTGDVQFGKADGDTARAGMGSSERPDIAAEFSDIPFDRGMVGMARSQDVNSANSQFFIMFDAGYFLNGQYTVVGKVTEGLEVLDAIKRGEGPNGSVLGTPDRMEKVELSQ